jgi:hypothetical protein
MTEVWSTSARAAQLGFWLTRLGVARRTAVEVSSCCE